MAYTLGDLTSRVQQRIKDTAYTSSDIKKFINDAQNAVANEYMLRFWEADPQSYTLTTNVRDITNGSGLPASFVLPYSLRITTTGFERRLVYIDVDDLEDLYQDVDSVEAATPYYWTFVGDTIQVFPKPDQGYTVKLRYTRRPTELTADADIPEIPAEFAELLIYGAAFRVMETKDNFDKAAIYENKNIKQTTALVNRYALKQRGVSMRLRLSKHRRV